MTNTPLPILATVQHAYNDVWSGRQTLIHAAALWIALILLIDGAGAFLGFSTEVISAENPADAGYVLGALLAMISAVVAIVGAAAIMVVWHRRILTGETLSGPLAPMRRETFRYILMEFVIALMAGMVAVLGVLLSMALGPIAPFGIMISVLAGVFLTIRVTLVLPAAALGDKTMTLKKSWELTKEHWIRLFAGSVLAAIPIVVAAAVAQNLLGLLGGTGSLVGEFVSLVGMIVQATVGAAYLSFCYLHITGKSAVPAITN